MAYDERVPTRRVSDADRDAVVELLRGHVADGRLDLDEFSDRLGEVYGARTEADLQLALRELPAEPSPARDTPRGRSAAQDPSRADFRRHLGPYVICNLFLVAIWAVTGAGYFWPIWPILGWGIGLALHAWTVFGNGEPDEGPPGG